MGLAVEALEVVRKKRVGNSIINSAVRSSAARGAKLYAATLTLQKPGPFSVGCRRTVDWMLEAILGSRALAKTATGRRRARGRDAERRAQFGALDAQKRVDLLLFADRRGHGPSALGARLDRPLVLGFDRGVVGFERNCKAEMRPIEWPTSRTLH